MISILINKIKIMNPIRKNINNFIFNQINKKGFSNFHVNASHKDTEDNTSETYFDFTIENYKSVNKILSRYPDNYKQAAIIPLLDLAQRQNNGYVSLSAMNKIAKIVEQPNMAVYEVCTFYTMFNRTKVGRKLLLLFKFKFKFKIFNFLIMN